MTPKDKLKLLVHEKYRDTFLNVVDDNGMFTLTNHVIKSCGKLIKKVKPLDLDKNEYPYDYDDVLYSSYEPESQGGNIGTYITIGAYPQDNGEHLWQVRLEEDNKWGGNPTCLSDILPYCHFPQYLS